MLKSKITRILFVTLFIFVPFLTLHSQEGEELPQVQEKSTEEPTPEQPSTIRINTSNDKETVLEILDESKKSIDQVETSQELQENIEELKADLEKYFKPSPELSTYTEEKLKEVESIKQNYGKKIDQSTDTSMANTIFEEAKQKINEVPTSLELLSSLYSSNTALEEKVDQLKSELAKKQDTERFVIKEFFSLLAIFLILSIIAFIVITYFKFKKYKITSLHKIKKLIEDYITDLRDSFESRYREINNRIQLLNEECKEVKAKTKIDTAINKPEAPLKPIDLPKPVEIVPDDPIDDFNNWAADPSRPLPNRFFYVKGEIKLRAEQSLTESYSPTEWICNKRTAKLYLLPNPNFFEELTNIKNFYKMDIGQLKPRGKNKIKVIEPCKMSDKGWIDNPGELEFK